MLVKTGYTTKRFNEQIKNNIERFDEDFRFKLTREEVENLRSKNSTSSWGASREDEKQKILVICSFAEKEVTWKVPKGFDLESAELVLCNYENTTSINIKPYEARVYLWNKRNK